MNMPLYKKKSSLVAVLFLLNQPLSFGFAPQAPNARADTSLGYLTDRSDPNLTFDRKEPLKEAARARRRRRQRQPTAPRTQQAYTLNSNKVSELTASSSARDVMTAIKRAQNLHDSEDIRVIGDFLLRGVDDSFAYGYKGSLLARFAVAALRLKEYDIACEAIKMRKLRFASFMAPFESAAIVRGLLRLDKTDEAFTLLEEELSVEDGNKDRLMHRASALGTIASKNFFENKPHMALQACHMLEELGPVVQQAGLQGEDLQVPWHRILAGANQCKAVNRFNSYDTVVLHVMQSFPLEPDTKDVLDQLCGKKE